MNILQRVVKGLNKNKNVIDSPLEGNFWRERERERGKAVYKKRYTKRVIQKA